MQRMEDLPLVLNATHVANVLGVSRPTAYEIMRRSDFPRIPLSKGSERGNVRVLREDLFKWLESQRQGA